MLPQEEVFWLEIIVGGTWSHIADPWASCGQNYEESNLG